MLKLLIRILCLILVLGIISCHSNKKQTKELNSSEFKGKKISLKYAKTFDIEEFTDYYVLTINDPWPEADKSYKYIFYRKTADIPIGLEADYKIQIPIKNLIVSSTTHIPPLEALGVLDQLIGFPNTNYISSQKARALIKSESITDVGNTQSLNTEVVIALNPGCIVSFAVKGENNSLSKIKEANIPVIYNADWVENHPLGKTEWIKFFGILFDKLDEANSIFEDIRINYEDATALAQKTDTSPTVISGALWKDTWYLPGGNSWQAKLMNDANARYIYADTEDSGSLSLSLESVLEKGKSAELWVAPAQFTSYSQMLSENAFYKEFEAFKAKNIYTFAKDKGETGGVIYFELASHRPDWVLKDLINIFHPALLPDYQNQFFKPLDP
jgi:iron complex transport system substrate-binding protein